MSADGLLQFSDRWPALRKHDRQGTAARLPWRISKHETPLFCRIENGSDLVCIEGKFARRSVRRRHEPTIAPRRTLPQHFRHLAVSECVAESALTPQTVPARRRPRGITLFNAHRISTAIHRFDPQIRRVYSAPFQP